MSYVLCTVYSVVCRMSYDSGLMSIPMSISMALSISMPWRGSRSRFGPRSKFRSRPRSRYRSKPRSRSRSMSHSSGLMSYVYVYVYA